MEQYTPVPGPSRDDFGSLADQMANFVQGTNGNGNNGIELRNDGKCGTFILKSTTPSANAPSVWMDINVDTKKLTFYKDVGSGWVSVGTINIS